MDQNCGEGYKYSFDLLVCETIKETNLNTDFIFHKYYLRYNDILKGKYVNYKCVSCYHVNVQMQPSIGVFQERCSAKTQ